MLPQPWKWGTSWIVSSIPTITTWTLWCSWKHLILQAPVSSHPEWELTIFKLSSSINPNIIWLQLDIFSSVLSECTAECVKMQTEGFQWSRNAAWLRCREQRPNRRSDVKQSTAKKRQTQQKHLHTDSTRASAWRRPAQWPITLVHRLQMC